MPCISTRCYHVKRELNVLCYRFYEDVPHQTARVSRTKPIHYFYHVRGLGLGSLVTQTPPPLGGLVHEITEGTLVSYSRPTSALHFYVMTSYVGQGSAHGVINKWREKVVSYTRLMSHIPSIQVFSMCTHSHVYVLSVLVLVARVRVGLVCQHIRTQ